MIQNHHCYFGYDASFHKIGLTTNNIHATSTCSSWFDIFGNTYHFIPDITDKPSQVVEYINKFVITGGNESLIINLFMLLRYSPSKHDNKKY
jgi:hypothetical protein